MPAAWPEIFLKRLQELDAREAPHGLYGLRRAYAPEGPLPSLAHLLASRKRTHFIHDHYPGIVRQDQFETWMGFQPQPGGVLMTVLEFATTKVRQYGSAHRLDEYYGKKDADPPWDLGKEIKSSILKHGEPPASALLLVLHTATEREVLPLLGRSVEPEYLTRHGLVHHTLAWPDRYDRQIHISLHLWLRKERRPSPSVRTFAGPVFRVQSYRPVLLP